MANTIMELLSGILNPNPGAGGLLSPGGYLQSTGLGPEQLARYHQQSGLGGGAPAAPPPPPQGAPSGAIAPQQAPMPAQSPSAPAGPSGGGLGGLLSGLFGGGASAGKNETIQWLQQQGMDPGTATLMAGNKQALQQYLLQRSQGQKPLEVNGRLVDPNTYQVLADFSDKDGQKLIDAGKGRLYDPNTKQWITAPDMGTDAPTVQTFYDKGGLEYKAQWDQQKKEWVPIGGSKVPSGGVTVTSPDGTTMTLGGAGQRLNEGQSKDIAYYTQGLDANARLSEMGGELTSFAQENVGILPLGIGNYLRTPEFRQAKQAGERFLTAVLRKETGAAVTETEWQKYGPMFLPIPGDDPATLQQKSRGREVALLAIRSGLGTAEAIAEANRIILGVEKTPLTPQPGGDAPSAIPPTGRDRLGTSRRLKFNPATGELE